LSDCRLSPLSTSPTQTSKIDDSGHAMSCSQPSKSPLSTCNHTESDIEQYVACTTNVVPINSNCSSDSSSSRIVRRSPSRTGIMSRLTQSPYRVKHTDSHLWTDEHKNNHNDVILSSKMPVSYYMTNNRSNQLFSTDRCQQRSSLSMAIEYEYYATFSYL
jgi:hypothetical protein